MLRLKDVDYALRLAESLGIEVPFGAAARTAFRRLVELGAGNENESRIIDVARGTAPRD
jgi:3-hydroxyisobutyrate dehydrogenase-like beta-hydroxyacid dehydrogenase